MRTQFNLNVHVMNSEYEHTQKFEIQNFSLLKAGGILSWNQYEAKKRNSNTDVKWRMLHQWHKMFYYVIEHYFRHRLSQICHVFLYSRVLE